MDILGQFKTMFYNVRQSPDSYDFEQLVMAPPPPYDGSALKEAVHNHFMRQANPDQ